MDFEFLNDSFKRHGYPHNVSLFVGIRSNRLWLSMRTFGLLEGPRCSIMPFLQCSDIETQKSQSMSYLGLKQVKNCHRILNTWRNTAASVGLDLDSSALWAMVLYLVTDLVRAPLKMFLHTATRTIPTCTSFCFVGLGTANDTGRY